MRADPGPRTLRALSGARVGQPLSASWGSIWRSAHSRAPERQVLPASSMAVAFFPLLRRLLVCYCRCLTMGV